MAWKGWLMKPIALTVLALLWGAHVCAAQAPTINQVFITLNGGYQLTSNDFSDGSVTHENGEDGRVDTTYAIKSGPTFDVGGGAVVWRRLGVGAAVSRFSVSTPASLTATTPHPFFFNRPRTVSGEAASLKREELAFHLQAVGVFPVGTRLQVLVFGGPSFFRMKQGVVTDFTYHGQLSVRRGNIRLSHDHRGERLKDRFQRRRRLRLLLHATGRPGRNGTICRNDREVAGCARCESGRQSRGRKGGRRIASPVLAARAEAFCRFRSCQLAGADRGPLGCLAQQHRRRRRIFGNFERSRRSDAAGPIAIGVSTRALSRPAPFRPQLLHALARFRRTDHRPEPLFPSPLVVPVAGGIGGVGGETAETAAWESYGGLGNGSGAVGGRRTTDNVRFRTRRGMAPLGQPQRRRCCRRYVGNQRLTVRSS